MKMLSLKDKLNNIISIHQRSKIPFFTFNSEHLLVYANQVAMQIFDLKKEDFNKRKLDFIYKQSYEKRLNLSEISVDELLRSTSVCCYYSIEKGETYFLIDTFFLGEDEKRGYFYSILREATSLEVLFVEKSLQALIKASLLKDNDTANHLERVNSYSRLIAEHLAKTQRSRFPEIKYAFIEKIGKVAALHDIGKIGTPDSILTKPTELTDDEFEIIKEHTINGAFILSSLAGEMARDIALFHHERWDGSGYPYNLRETDIPLCARIVALADVYDALRMARYYKNPLSHNEAKTIILAERGFHFDPAIVDAFNEIHNEFARIFNTWGDEEEIEVLEELSSI